MANLINVFDSFPPNSHQDKSVPAEKRGRTGPPLSSCSSGYHEAWRRNCCKEREPSDLSASRGYSQCLGRSFPTRCLLPSTLLGKDSLQGLSALLSSPPRYLKSAWQSCRVSDYNPYSYSGTFWLGIWHPDHTVWSRPHVPNWPPKIVYKVQMCGT